MRLMLHLCCALTFMLLTTSLFATDYVFTGNGNWTDPNNWEGGAIPLSNPQGNNIIIKGVALNGFYSCSINPDPSQPCAGPGKAQDALYSNYGTIIIEAGGSLTLQNYTQFSNGGTFIVYGTLINKTKFEAYGSGSLTVYGTFLNEGADIPRGSSGWIGNQGSFTVESGGVLDNHTWFSNNFMAHGQLIVKSGATIKNSGYYLNLEYATISNGVTLNNSTGSLVGSPVINCNVTNSGTLAPGNSPGTFTINGDYTATGTAIHKFEIGGTAVGAYDVLKTSDAVNLNGTLNVSLINGYVPTKADNIPIITGNINGTFATANIPSQYVLVYNLNSVVLKSATALPVNFVSIEAAKEKDKIKVSWKVAGEHNVAKYEIEKSMDGTTFKPIGSVTASGQNLYNYTDIQPETKSFYRIKSVDLDGSIKYSSVVIYRQEKNVNGLKIYPTPVKKDMILQHPTAAAHSKITIIAMDGRSIISVLPTPGTQQTTINIPAAKAGTYIIQFENAGAISTAKFIKQ